ncbi:MAG: pseudouridine synthase [Lachnospiraceae bacterium]|nr:pseudouridine synthase [Lachnospiraceae bacterium]
MERMRLNKYIAACGLSSRRDADKLIEAGQVRVNGKTATPGMSVDAADTVEVNGKTVKPANTRIVLAYNKPKGVICTERDRHAKRTIADEIKNIKVPLRLTYAGRLDKDSEGLILLTNDGNLIDRLMRGKNAHEKEYEVRVDREITDSFVREMSGGVYLKELDETTRPCRIIVKGKYTFNIVLTQGLNRQIRRMCETLGYRVKYLRRIRVANVSLGKLKPGEYRELTKEELEGIDNIE